MENKQVPEIILDTFLQFRKTGMRLRSGKAVQVTAILVLYNISVHKYKEAIIELIL